MSSEEYRVGIVAALASVGVALITAFATVVVAWLTVVKDEVSQETQRALIHLHRAGVCCVD